MPTFREDPAAYMRAYRARKRREAAGASPPAKARLKSAPPVTIAASLPRDAHLIASPAELATVRAKVAAIGPGAVITKTDGRFDVLSLAAFDPRQRPTAASRELTLARPPLQGEVIPQPRSMIADGGAPPRRYAAGASIAEATAMIRAYAAEQARVNVETARRLEALERYVGDQERDKAAKASGVAKWAEARRLWFNMLRP
jgi:hypothetical protein